MYYTIYYSVKGLPKNRSSADVYSRKSELPFIYTIIAMIVTRMVICM